MIEIVFGDSACGSLKQAQHYGKGSFSAGSVGIILGHSDARNPTEEEIRAAQKDCEERERLAWERATPMGGNPADVYGFAYGLSIGDISEDVPGEKRRQVLDWYYGIFLEINEEPSFTGEMMQRGAAALEEVCARISAGEAVRIWYSDQPDELCGMYWFMAHLSQLGLCDGQVFLVQQPGFDAREDNTVVTYSGWGEVSPGEWHRYMDLQQTASKPFFNYCAMQWRKLQQENASLRAVLNGQLVSAPETIYDAFILREIEAESDEFHEANLIGNVLGKYQLGIGDAWVAQRIEVMIANGGLIPVTEPAPDGPIYHRRLKKCKKI